MKRIYFLLITVLSMPFCNAQNITDGLRYADENITGTARFNALSGAFGALGGDLSAIAINPAGSAVFLKNDAAASFAVSDSDNTTNYFNTVRESGDNEVSLNQAGMVFVFDNSENSNWKKFTLSLTYNNTQNFDDDVFAAGTGNLSIGSFFTQQAQGIPLDLLQLRSGETISQLYNFLGETEGVTAQNAFLGYQAFIFDPVSDDPANTAYVGNFSSGNFNQQYSYLTRGYTGKYTANFATQYGDHWFFGVNLNSHAIDYDRSTFLFETNNNPLASVDQIGFENNLSVLGAGFSAQIGAIAKFEDVRIGLSFDTPTWFEISEETSQYLETRRSVDGQNITEIINPRVVNVFENYNLRTPGKITASGAYIFGKDGLISVDYSYKDYSSIEFRPQSDTFFANENTTIENQLAGASTFRLGGEYRLSQLSLRGGYSYAQSPYKNGTTIGDTSGFSLGLGYDFGNYNFDVSYSRTEQDREQQLYNIGLTSSALVSNVNNNIVFTLGVQL
tara:strand:+ start:14864 stop:16375 length:1512 start_codon:yes stop_codon:yes gene_type:complete